MGYRCWGERFVTSDFASAPVHYQRFVFPESYALKAIRSRFVIYNNPTFSSLEMRIYSAIGTSLGQLLYTSTKTWTKSEITSENNASREIYFDFDFNPYFRGNDSIFLVPWLTGYTGTAASHVAWVKGYPDPAYTTGLTINIISAAKMPYAVGFIGAPLDLLD